MRSYYIQIFSLSLLLLVGAAHANPRDLNWAQDISSHEQNIAIVVGVQTYNQQHSGFNPLSHTVNDANKLSNTLQQLGYRNPRTLINQQATKNFILNKIRQEAKRVRNGEGTLIFAFSGHGGRIGNDNYLATFDSLSSDFQRTGLSVKEVVQTIRQTGIKRAVLFLDACRNDAIHGARSRSLPGFRDKNYGRGIQILYAAEQNHYSYEHSKLQQGVFSYFLNKGLQGQAAYNGVITFPNLARFVERSVMDWTSSTFETTQRPYRGAGSEYQGDFILAHLGNTPEIGSSGKVGKVGKASSTDGIVDLSSNLRRECIERNYPWRWTGSACITAQELCARKGNNWTNGNCIKQSICTQNIERIKKHSDISTALSEVNSLSLSPSGCSSSEIKQIQELRNELRNQILGQ